MRQKGKAEPEFRDGGQCHYQEGEQENVTREDTRGGSDCFSVPRWHRSK